jgi:hypothetical protein
MASEKICEVEIAIEAALLQQRDELLAAVNGLLGLGSGSIWNWPVAPFPRIRGCWHEIGRLCQSALAYGSLLPCAINFGGG